MTQFIVLAASRGSYFPEVPEKEVVTDDGRLMWQRAEPPSLFGPYDTQEEAEAAKDELLMRDFNESPESKYQLQAFVLPLMNNIDRYFEVPSGPE